MSDSDSSASSASSEEEKEAAKKAKKEKRKKSSSSESEAEDKKSKKDKKKQKKAKKDKSSKKEKKAKKKELKEAKKILKAAGITLPGKETSLVDPKIVEQGARHGFVPSEKLDIEKDYFRKATEFRVWLHTKHRVFLDELPTDTAKKHFETFVSLWNAGLLEQSLYTGVDRSTLAAASMTRHKWGFAKKMSEDEQFQLATARDDVDTGTFHQNAGQGFALKTMTSSALPPKSSSSSGPADEVLRAEQRKKLEKTERKRFNESNKLIEEELVPKKEGRERQLEVKRMKGPAGRGERDDGFGSYGDAELMGDADSFEAVRRREALRQESFDKRRADGKATMMAAKQSKLEEYQKREADKMKQFIETMGLTNKLNEKFQ